MGSGSRLNESDLDPARALIVRRSRELRIPFKEMSLLMKRNQSYIQQFLGKRIPQHLPEDVRHQLAGILGVQESELRTSPLPAALPSSGAAASPAQQPGREAAPTTSPAHQMPLYREGPDPLALTAQPPLRISRSDFMGQLPPSCVAVALSEPRGLLQPWHILLCNPEAATKAGDVVLVVAAERVVGAGLLSFKDEGTLRWAEGGVNRETAASGASLWRVLAVRSH